MGVVVKNMIKPSYVKQCVAFVDSDDFDNPGPDELQFVARFKRRTREEREAYADEITEIKRFVDGLTERYGDIDTHRQKIRNEAPDDYKRLTELETSKKDLLGKLAYEDWIGQKGLQDENEQDFAWTEENKRFLWDFGHGEIRAAIVRGWLASRQGATAREGN